MSLPGPSPIICAVADLAERIPPTGIAVLVTQNARTVRTAHGLTIRREESANPGLERRCA